MCRLFAWHSPVPLTVNEALATDADALRELSKIHQDGWGMAFDSEGHIELVRDVKAAHESDAYAKATGETKSTDGIVHLRWATEELQVCLPNTHPFIKSGPAGPIAFCHNGGIPRGDLLNSLIDPDLIEGMEGDTDSEFYFAALITALREHDNDFVEAYRQLLKDVEVLEYTSLNTLVLTHEKLYVLCNHKPANLPAHVDADYYELNWATIDGVTSAWSSGVRPSVTTGTELENGYLLEIDRASGSTQIHHVH